MVTSSQIHKLTTDQLSETTDLLAIEEPLEIRLAYHEENTWEEQQLIVTMRTPGHDRELATGFLFAEGIISSPDHILTIKHCQQSKYPDNTLKITLSKDRNIDLNSLKRNFLSHSSCGVCGKTAIDSLKIIDCEINPLSKGVVPYHLLYHLPERIRDKQYAYSHTGGLHAAALFDHTGTLILLREDVGRHNALDKLIGAAFYQQLLPLSDYILLVSGRVSFELVQKALVAGIKIMTAIGAPSSLAMEVAKKYRLTLIGFLRDYRMNIYCGHERILAKHNEHGIQTP